MSIFLVGAGPDYVAFPEVFDRFAEEVSRHVRPEGPVRVAVVVHDRGGNPAARLPEYAEPLNARNSCDVVPVLLGREEAVNPAVFDGVDAVVVGGGLTPAYWEALKGAAAAILRRVADGAPYLGFSAGAMITPESALIGGYRVDGREVCGEECSEGLDDVAIRDGLGLAPFAVDVHAAQTGTLSRAVGAVAAGLAARAVAIDENTAIVLPAAGSADFQVIGTGNCWDIRTLPGGPEGSSAVTVTVLGAT
ncbi:Type 1 glutamine amidotransferase-like domain-containing protein [Pseudarthrobacter sp. NS4]|uniref:Type 1 glutamine amidotransferase-like domain-containing protein n=1 Tax=Pseudarthrobacter sp. NS4 TaxID=2973976 RepID=UPI002163A601|nr:Type 1 glutamine amidotransferase-like domain-containing protein [Pseudarthrobacter sp. NS4]